MIEQKGTTMRGAPTGRSLRAQPRSAHHICAWCRCDLGLLTYPSALHSYGICVSCTRQYYAELYDETEQRSTASAGRERAVGETYG